MGASYPLVPVSKSVSLRIYLVKQNHSGERCFLKRQDTAKQNELRARRNVTPGLESVLLIFRPLSLKYILKIYNWKKCNESNFAKVLRAATGKSWHSTILTI